MKNILVDAYDIVWNSNKKERPTRVQMEISVAVDYDLFILSAIEQELKKKYKCNVKSFHFKKQEVTNE